MVDHTSGKVLFAIYTETGRALLLGDLYVRERLNDFYVIPEKDNYAPGEKANLIVFFLILKLIF